MRPDRLKIVPGNPLDEETRWNEIRSELMRRICLTLGASAVLLMVSPAASLEAGCAKCGGSGGSRAGACGAPDYGSMSPGCCEHVPSGCENVWDGYCQERHCGWSFRLCWPSGWWPAGQTCEPPAAAPPTSATVPAPAAPIPAPTAIPTPAPIPAPAAPVPGATNTPQEKKVDPPKEKEGANRNTLRMMRLPEVNRLH
jgi:hypothetical protein